MLEQFFNHGVFHADPHPANLLLLKSGGLGLVDFGMVGTLDDQIRVQQLQLREYITSGDADGAFQVLLHSLEPLPRNDLWQFKAEFRDIVADWVGAVSSNTAGLRYRSSGYFIQRLCRAMRRARISIPVSVVQLYRAILISDAVMLALSPRLNWVPELSIFLKDERRRRLKELWLDVSSGTRLGSIAATGLLARSAFDKSLAWVSYRLPELSRHYPNRARAPRTTAGHRSFVCPGSLLVSRLGERWLQAERVVGQRRPPPIGRAPALGVLDCWCRGRRGALDGRDAQFSARPAPENGHRTGLMPMRDASTVETTATQRSQTG